MSSGAKADETHVPLVSLDSGCRVKVSSVLNRDVRQFGKKFMFDGNDETCWNSDQGSPQYVAIELPSPASVYEVRLRFQGGFTSSDCTLLGGDSEQDMTELGTFYPLDINSLQQDLYYAYEEYKDMHTAQSIV